MHAYGLTCLQGPLTRILPPKQGSGQLKLNEKGEKGGAEFFFLSVRILQLAPIPFLFCVFLCSCELE